MTLDSILSKFDIRKKSFEFNDTYKTIRYIEQDEYKGEIYEYVEPEFYDADSKMVNTPRFILFSAPGATGKTALAKNICYKRNGVYWNLPDNKIAEYSFQGAITEAVGFNNISNFVKSVQDGETFLVIDAFDEAEAGSGRSGIEFFLRDLNQVTSNAIDTCAILLARTESAIFIKEYLEKAKIPYKHYEVGYFAEYNSKKYITNSLERLNIDITPVVKACIEEQFKEIHRIYPTEDAKEFLGYAPVLDAIAAAYREERNTTILLQATEKGENNCSLIVQILKKLLTREQEKFEKALKNKFSTFDTTINCDSVYGVDEQLWRIIGFMMFDDVNCFGEISQEIPAEYRDEYLEVVNTQLPQHPFILPKNNEEKTYYEFTGPAFYDYIVAYGLANSEISEYVKTFLAENGKYSPSQMLVEFYEYFSEKKIKGEFIPLMYNSFKAHAHLGENVALRISGDMEDCFVEFSLSNGNNEKFQLEFTLEDLSKGIYVNQVSNCYIDIDGIVYMGNKTGEARINNSVIICNELIWGSEKVLIEAYSPGMSMLVVDSFINCPNVNPRFEIKTDNKTNLRISASNIGNYYKFLGYKDTGFGDVTDTGFESFSYIVRRIFGCMRCHSKDTPARKSDYINNRIVSTNHRKRKVLEFLISEGIIYTDDQMWLYKLNLDKLSEYAIRWNAIKDGDFSTLTTVYKKFIEHEG